MSRLPKKCWEARGLSRNEQEAMAAGPNQIVFACAQVFKNTIRSSARAFGSHRPLSGCSLTMKTRSRRSLRLGDERRGQGPKRQPAEERAPVHHSMTWSARPSSDCGIVSPSAFAAFRLITSSNLVGCSTGRSLGWAPSRIRWTYLAARRNRSPRSAP
jgi:hypothetical protein